MEFKDRLKAARKHAKLNQAELADKTGISQTSISDLERGKSKGTAYAVQLAATCKVNAVWLATGKGGMLDPAMDMDDFVRSSDRQQGNLLTIAQSELVAVDHVRREAEILALTASPRSNAALRKIIEAADAGRLSEGDIVLLEKIAAHISTKPVQLKEGASSRFARKSKEDAAKDSE